MLGPTEFRALVSGQQRGLRAAALRAVLRMAEVPYTWAVGIRNRRFDRGSAYIARAPVPVISVGNLTLGGTGKTPLVAWLCRHFREQGVRVAIISRGYGATEGGRNDEALELEQKLPDVPHLQNPDRVAAANVAVEELGMQLIVLDDGFQHRRLARDLDIVVMDALEPFGHEHVFPRGTLREPLSGLARADAIVLSRADLVDVPTREAIRERVSQFAPNAIWCEAAQQPAVLVGASGATAALGELAEKPVVAFCGIGNPAGFRGTLASCGFDVRDFREFPDHHAYNRKDVESLANWAEGQNVAAALCTHKDLVKLGIDQLGRRRLWALAIETNFVAGGPLLEARLRELVRRIRE